MKKRIIAVPLLAAAIIKICAMGVEGVTLRVPESIEKVVVGWEFGEEKHVKSDAEEGKGEENPLFATSPTETPVEFNPEAIIKSMEPDITPMPPAATLESNGSTVVTPPPVADESKEVVYNVPEIDNDSGVAIDAAAMLEQMPEITLAEEGATILIVHTHGSEAYLGTDGYRTLDRTKDVVRVGDALTTELQNRGYNVIHDRECYDYPEYNGSYGRSLEVVKKWIEENPTIQVVFDIHRDALELADGTAKGVYYTAEDGTKTAQVMIIATNGAEGLEHPNWRENMKFALRLQSAADSMYDGLMRPLVVSGRRYNEHLAPGYLLLEVGSIGNTVEEAVAGVRLFAESLDYVLKELKNIE